MRWFAIGLLLTLISPVYGSDFVTKVMKTDLELQMAEDGFSERDIENIKIIAMGITESEVCERRNLDGIASFVAKKSGLPLNILLMQAKKYAMIDIVFMEQNPGYALAFCKLARKVRAK
jgi:hypothetical protein